MKKIIATLLLSVCVSPLALAGDIPGSNPGPPCTQNCPAAPQPEVVEVSIGDIVLELFALVF